MSARIQPRHDLSPDEIDAIEDNLYDHNAMRRDAMTARGSAL